MPPITPSNKKQNNGPKNEYVPLQAVPSPAPHILLPAYQVMKVTNVKRPLTANQIIAGPLVKAFPTRSRETSRPPAIIPITGTTINKFAIPEVT